MERLRVFREPRVVAATVLGALALVLGVWLGGLLGFVLLLGGVVLLGVGLLSAVAFGRGEMDMPHEALPPGAAARAESLDSPHGITRGLP